MKRFLRRVSKFLPTILIFALLFNGVAKADVNDFTVHSFNADFLLSRDDPQGTLTITETIDLTFSGYNHGILRAIPEKYGRDSVHPKVLDISRDGRNETFTTYGENNNMVLKIGSASEVITGRHTYEIRYRVENVVKFYENYDELYWDVNGDQWLQQFQDVSVTVTPSNGVSFSGTPAPVCYTGEFGSTGQDCTISLSDGGKLNAKTTRTLNANETLTFVAAVPKGIFRPMNAWEKYRGYAPLVVFIFLEILVVSGAVRRWRKIGKDYPRSPVIAPAFGPPKKLGVLGSAFVYSDATLPKHISASIIDLAVRGYIKIIETEEKGFLKSKTKYSLELLKSPQDLSGAERSIIAALFESSDVGSSVELDTKKSKLYAEVPKISKVLSAETTALGMYETSPEAAKGKQGKYLFFAIALLVLAFLTVSFTTWVGVVIGFLALFAVIGLQAAMVKRSRLGSDTKQELEGLKLYLGMAEKDRLRMLQGANAPLAENAKEPKRTVKLFEKLLPYAIVFGVEKTWAEAFKDLYTTPPDWYQGNWSTFNTIVFVSHLNSSVSAVNSSFSAPSSSGGSGFSGGGSAGGGGGGGGGGGW